MASESQEAADRPALAMPMFGGGVDMSTAAPMFGSMTSSGDDIDYLEYDKKGRGMSERSAILAFLASILLDLARQLGRGRSKSRCHVRIRGSEWLRNNLV